MTEQKSKIPSAAILLRDAWKIYKARPRIFIGILAVESILYIPFFFLWSRALYRDSAPIFIFLILNFVLILMMRFWAQVSLLYAICAKTEKIDIRESYKRAWHKLYSFIWIGFLANLVIGVGLILLIIPAIIFFVWFSLPAVILVVENIKGSNALMKSREYVRGYWWAVFGRLIFMIVAFILLILPFFILGELAKQSHIPFIENFFNVLAYILLTPLFVIYNYLIYERLKEIKGKFHLNPPGGFSWLRVLIFSPIVLLALSLLIIPIILLSRLS